MWTEELTIDRIWLRTGKDKLITSLKQSDKSYTYLDKKQINWIMHMDLLRFTSWKVKNQSWVATGLWNESCPTQDEEKTARRNCLEYS